MEEEENEVSANWVTYGGSETVPVGLKVYLSESGMITLRFDEDSWLQMSPVVAAQFIENVSTAIKHAKASMED